MYIHKYLKSLFKTRFTFLKLSCVLEDFTPDLKFFTELIVLEKCETSLCLVIIVVIVGSPLIQG